MNAQISFIEGKYSLIHIPLKLYSSLLQPILRVLLPHGGSIKSSEPEGLLEGISIDNKHGFLNISITPIECSIVCHVSWAQNVFSPIIARLSEQDAKECQISKDTYIVFSVSSAGMEAGQRVLDLTAPLAMAGIPIFFITTYYTDFILVPSKDRHTVGAALLDRGFEFSENDSAYVAPTPMSHARLPSATLSVSNSDPPRTPPPSNIAELQHRTFTQLKKKNVTPFIVPSLHLVQCSGKEILPRDTYNTFRNGHSSSSSYPHCQSASKSWLDTLDAKLYLGLVAALAQRPRFLSLTLAQEDAPSLLLDKDLLGLFGDSVTGDTDACLVPIFLDLVDLPLESTGIVCGVAGRLGEELGEEDRKGGVGMGGGGWGGSGLSYLSTARAGAVVLGSEESGRALGVLLERLKAEGCVV